MVERNLNVFSVALLGVVFTLFLTIFAATPIVCGLGPDVHLPWATTGTVVAGSESDLDIHVKRDRQIYVGNAPVPQGRLRAELEKISAYSSERHVLISADGAVPYATVEAVLVATRDAGFHRTSLVTFRGTRLEAWHRGGAV